MTNYVEYNDKIAFHPGYYIKEIVENLGITQEDFAKRLDTTPKNISLIIRGEQRLSTDMAMKLSNMLGTSVNYWLNLQNAYDAALAEIEAVEELEKDKTILRLLGYDYFEQHFNLPHLPRQLELQVKELRKFLGVANLQVLQGEILLSILEATQPAWIEQILSKRMQWFKLQPIWRSKQRLQSSIK